MMILPPKKPTPESHIQGGKPWDRKEGRRVKVLLGLRCLALLLAVYVSGSGEFQGWTKPDGGLYWC